MPLTDTAIQAFKAPPKGTRPTRHLDRDGLYLHVADTGTKSFVLRYVIHGTSRTIALGRYPALSLKKARERAMEKHAQAAAGIDPVQDKRRKKAEAVAHDAARFAVIATEWLATQTWTPATRKQYDRHFERDLLPALGRLPVSDIKTATVQAMIDKVAERGAVVPSHVLNHARGVLSLAVHKGLVPYNVAREVRVPKRERGAKKSYRHLESTADVRSTLESIDAYGGQPETKIALRLLLLTFVRPKELREATWADFDLSAVDHMGQPAPVWNIPTNRMKMRRPHVVPLSTQAVALLAELRALTGSAVLLFPNERDEERPMARNRLYRALHDHMKVPTTAHGFRHLASTTLNSQGYNRDWIEMQLAHWEEGVRGAYNKAQWLPERRKMMQGYADWIDHLRVSESNVVPLRRTAS